MFAGRCQILFCISASCGLFAHCKARGMAAVSLLAFPKRFKRAVKQSGEEATCEAYRKHKELLLNVYQNEEQNLMLAVIYLSDRLVDSSEIEEKLASLLVRILDNKEWNDCCHTYILSLFTSSACISPKTSFHAGLLLLALNMLLEAIKKHGPFYGLYLSVRRILRCHPWVDLFMILFLIFYLMELFDVHTHHLSTYPGRSILNLMPGWFVVRQRSVLFCGYSSMAGWRVWRRCDMEQLLLSLKDPLCYSLYRWGWHW